MGRLSLALLIALQGAAAAQRCPVEPRQRPRCAVDMIELVRAHHVPGPNVSPEMLLCVTWTESAFCNVRRRGSRSVGFGQVVLAAQRGLFWRLARQQGLPRFSEADVLARDGLSVAAASLVLASGMIAAKGDVDRALAAYAGPPNRAAVPSWRACERELRALGLFERDRPLTLSAEDRKSFAAALDAANRHRPAGSRADPATVLCD